MPTLLVDTYSLFFRSFYGLPPMNTAAGLPTNALYGFSSLLLKLLREERPEAGAFALDLPTPSFRHALAPSYKAGRPATPGPLRQQLTLLPELLDAFGFAQHAAEGFEADDVLASLAQRLAEPFRAAEPAAASAEGPRVLIASGDRDLLQLVDDQIHVLFLGQRGKPAKRYAPVSVHERFGVPAAQLPAYVALVGDSSDNLPKVAGIGEVTASRLIAEYRDIDTLLAHLPELSDARLGAKLRAHADQMRASEQLARLRTDVPLTRGPLSGAFDKAAAARAHALFEKLEFKSLLPRLTPWLEA
ncbi:MAG TPA: 5'-3' exonuclease H3TH domain-containing protein [Polyangiales bacterium]